MDTQYEWEGNDDMASAYDPLEETDFSFDFEQQAKMWLGTDEDEIFIDGLMGGGVGPWKVSLSAQAMKDLMESRSEGILSIHPSFCVSFLPPSLPAMYSSRSSPNRESPTHT